MRVLACVFLLIATVNGTASAQHAVSAEGTDGLTAITIQVLDGSSGKRMTSDAVSVRCLFLCRGFAPAPAGGLSKGQFRVMVPESATKLTVFAANDDYEFCDDSEPEEVPYELHTIQNSGVLGGNDCKPLNAGKLVGWAPTPGRLVVFAHRLSLWEKLKRRLWGPC